MSDSSPIQQAASILLQAKTDIIALLEGTEHGMTLLTVDSQLTNLVNRLGHISGSFVQTIVKNDFPPVTDFFGEKIEAPKQITKEDLTPTRSEKEIFLAKVDNLQAQFDTIAPEGLLNAYTIPEDVAVLRGVAKRAGVDEYDTRDINEKFIEDISKGLKQKAADLEEQERIDAQLSAGAANGTEPVDIDPFGDEDDDDDITEPITNTKPLAKWNKTELQAELTKREIPFDLEATNKELIALLETPAGE